MAGIFLIEVSKILRPNKNVDCFKNRSSNSSCSLILIPGLRQENNAVCLLAEFKEVGDTYGRNEIDEERMHSVAGITFGMAHVCEV